MNNHDIDDLFDPASRRGSVDPVLLDRISETIGSSLRPVRPLPPTRVLITVLATVCLALATAGAAVLGLHGIQKMDALEIALIFPALLVLLGWAAAASVSEMIPGSRPIATPAALAALSSAALVAVFALLFHDYRVDRFVSQGLTCLIAGLLQAVPAALAAWLILRRGFGVNPLAAGLARGTLAGLAGVCMLELHCANFQAPHVMLWHTAVIPVSGAACAGVVWIARSLRRPR
jgi:hypothetical protein